jgi:uncharacterized membrane protein
MISPKKKDDPSLKTKLGTYFATGLIALLPLALTIFILRFIFNTIDNILGGIISPFSFVTDSRLWYYGGKTLAFLALLLLVFLVGVLARNVVGRRVISSGEMILTSIPFIRKIYTTIQQISDAVLRRKKKVFQRVVLLEYPRKGVYTLGFVTSESGGTVNKAIKKRTLNVFISTTPNPTSGFLLVVPEKEAIPLDMTVEEGMKLIISGGVLSPPEKFYEAHQFTAKDSSKD